MIKGKVKQGIKQLIKIVNEQDIKTKCRMSPEFKKELLAGLREGSGNDNLGEILKAIIDN